MAVCVVFDVCCGRWNKISQRLGHSILAIIMYIIIHDISWAPSVYVLAFSSDNQ